MGRRERRDRRQPDTVAHSLPSDVRDGRMAVSDSTRCHAVDQLPVCAGAASGERDAPAPAGDATRAEPGMACEAELQCTRRKGKLILPLQAVGSAPQLHSVAAADGSFDLWLGEFSVSPAGVRAQRQQEHSGNESVPSGGAAAADRADVHLRIMSEGAERYCDLSQYTADGDWQGWKVLHTFTLPGWGSGKVKGREAAQQARLAESTLSSLHKLVKQQVVDLKVASDEDLDSFTRAVRVSVLLKAAVITHGAVPAADLESFHTGRKYSSDLRKVMGCFQPSFVDSESEAAPAGGGEASCGSFDLQELYSAMKHPLTDEPAEPHEALLPTLRPYQLRAVRWMQSREDDAGCRAPARHPLLRELPCSCGKLLYYCEWTGHVATEPTSFSDTVRGGVLCDEMGLGKTVELLHLVLSRPHSLSAHTSVAVLDGVPGSGEGAAESGTESCTPMEPSASTGPCAELAAEPGLGAKEVKAANPFDWMSIDESDSDFGGVQSRDASLASAEEGLPLKRLANDLGTGSVGSPVDRKRSRVGEVERVSSEKREVRQGSHGAKSASPIARLHRLKYTCLHRQTRRCWKAVIRQQTVRIGSMLGVVLRCILMPEEENAGPTVPLRTITKIGIKHASRLFGLSHQSSETPRIPPNRAPAPSC